LEAERIESDGDSCGGLSDRDTGRVTQAPDLKLKLPEHLVEVGGNLLALQDMLGKDGQAPQRLPVSDGQYASE
jgi:hypothetical protein